LGCLFYFAHDKKNCGQDLSNCFPFLLLARRHCGALTHQPPCTLPAGGCAPAGCSHEWRHGQHHRVRSSKPRAEGAGSGEKSVWCSRWIRLLQEAQLCCRPRADHGACEARLSAQLWHCQAEKQLPELFVAATKILSARATWVGAEGNWSAWRRTYTPLHDSIEAAEKIADLKARCLQLDTARNSRVGLVLLLDTVQVTRMDLVWSGKTPVLARPPFWQEPHSDIKRYRCAPLILRGLKIITFIDLRVLRGCKSSQFKPICANFRFLRLHSLPSCSNLSAFSTSSISSSEDSEEVSDSSSSSSSRAPCPCPSLCLVLLDQLHSHES